MSDVPFQELANVCGGVTFLTLFAACVADMWMHRNQYGKPQRGLSLGGDRLNDEQAAWLQNAEPEHGSWGWLMRDGEVWVLFADPYDVSDGGLRIETPWPYRAVLDPTARTVRYRGPAMAIVMISLVLLPLAPLLLWFNHLLVRDRLHARLAAMVEQDGASSG